MSLSLCLSFYIRIKRHLFVGRHNITDGSDLFAYYVKAMADAVKKTGKQAMIWGPAQLKRLQPGDAVPPPPHNLLL